MLLTALCGCYSQHRDDTAGMAGSSGTGGDAITDAAQLPDAAHQPDASGADAGFDAGPLPLSEAYVAYNVSLPGQPSFAGSLYAAKLSDLDHPRRLDTDSTGRELGLHQLLVAPDDSTLLASGALPDDPTHDGQYLIYHHEMPVRTQSLVGFSAGQYSPDGKWLLGLDASQRLCLIDLHSTTPSAPIYPWPSTVKIDSFAFSPDSQVLGALSLNGQQSYVVQLVTNAGSPSVFAIDQLPDRSYSAPRFSPDSRYMLHADSTAWRIFDRTTQQDTKLSLAPQQFQTFTYVATGPDRFYARIGADNAPYSFYAVSWTDGSLTSIAAADGVSYRDLHVCGGALLLSRTGMGVDLFEDDAGVLSGPETIDDHSVVFMGTSPDCAHVVYGDANRYVTATLFTLGSPALQIPTKSWAFPNSSALWGKAIFSHDSKTLALNYSDTSSHGGVLLVQVAPDVSVRESIPYSFIGLCADCFSAQFSADDAWFSYTAITSLPGVSRLYRVGLAGAAHGPEPLTPALSKLFARPSGGQVLVVYDAFGVVDGQPPPSGLCSVDIASGTSTELVPATRHHPSSASHLTYEPNTRRVAFASDARLAFYPEPQQLALGDDAANHAQLVLDGLSADVVANPQVFSPAGHLIAGVFAEATYPQVASGAWLARLGDSPARAWVIRKAPSITALDVIGFDAKESGALFMGRDSKGSFALYWAGLDDHNVVAVSERALSSAFSWLPKTQRALYTLLEPNLDHAHTDEQHDRGFSVIDTATRSSHTITNEVRTMHAVSPNERWLVYAVDEQKESFSGIAKAIYVYDFAQDKTTRVLELTPHAAVHPYAFAADGDSVTIGVATDKCTSNNDNACETLYRITQADLTSPSAVYLGPSPSYVSPSADWILVCHGDQLSLITDRSSPRAELPLTQRCSSELSFAGDGRSFVAGDVLVKLDDPLHAISIGTADGVQVTGHVAYDETSSALLYASSHGLCVSAVYDATHAKCLAPSNQPNALLNEARWLQSAP